MSETEFDRGQTQVQTIGPLLLQLHGLGFDEPALAAARRAYDLATELWSVNFQSSGRPFLNHPVGAASMVARHGGSLPLILAALVHSAYHSGDFGVRIAGAWGRRRRRVRKVIGEEAEAFVHRFHELGLEFETRWDRILGSSHDASTLSDLDKTVLFFRVCHDVDDFNDYPFSSSPRRKRLKELCFGSIALARALRRPELAGLLESAYSHGEAWDALPEVIQGRHNTGYIVVPKAFGKRFVPAAAEVVHRLRNRRTIRA